MTYTQTLIDSFTGGTLSGTIWNEPGQTNGISIVSNALQITAAHVSTEQEVDTNSFSFDLHSGIFAFKYSKSGTTSTTTSFYIGLYDASNNYCELQTVPIANTWNSWADGVGATTSGDSGSANAFGSAWNNGDWLGFGNYGINGGNDVHAYKSSDGVNWTEIASFNITGAIDLSATGFFIGVIQDGTTSNFVATIDDFSTFAYTAPGVTYAQTVIDNFNDNSFDAGIWVRTNSTQVVEASAVMTVTPGNAANVELVTQATFDLTNGIVAAKFSKTGTTNAGTQFSVNIGTTTGISPSGNQAQATSQGVSGLIFWDNRNSTTLTSPTNIGTPVGPTANSGWTAGTWFGVGNMGATNILHCYKSTDGQTWTELSHVTLGGTFSKTASHVDFMANDTTSVSGSKMVIEDPSYFVPSTVAGKVRSGGAMVKPTAVKVRSGGAWVVPTAVKVRSGGAWVVPTN